MLFDLDKMYINFFIINAIHHKFLIAIFFILCKKCLF